MKKVYREKWNKRCIHKKGTPFACYKPAVVGTYYCELHQRRNDLKPQDLIVGSMEKMTEEKRNARRSITTPYLLEGEEDLYKSDIAAVEQQIVLLQAIIIRLAKKKAELDVDNSLELVEVILDGGKTIRRSSIESIDDRITKYNTQLLKAIETKRKMIEQTPEQQVQNIMDAIKTNIIDPIQCPNS